MINSGLISYVILSELDSPESSVGFIIGTSGTSGGTISIARVNAGLRLEKLPAESSIV